MTEPARRFEGARIKFARGQEHLAEIAQLVADHERQDPYKIRTETGEETLYRVEISSEPPFTLGAVIGDFLHNMRSSLDLVACCLVEYFMTAPDLTKVQFPLEFKNGRLNDRGRKWLLDHPEVIQIVEGAHVRHGPALEALQSLSNQDKHRLITTAVVRVQAAKLIFDYANNTASFDCSPDIDPELWQTPIETGSIIGRGSLPGVGVAFRLALLVGDRAFEINKLNAIQLAVAEILDFALFGKWPASSPSPSEFS